MDVGTEREAYLDPKVPSRLLPMARQTLMVTLRPEEVVLGMFSVARFRRAVSVLVVTDRRLLTLGETGEGVQIVDEVQRAEVREVTIERRKVFSTGEVTAHTAGAAVGLGMLNYDDTTFLRLEEVLAARVAGAAPPLPRPGSGTVPGAEVVREVAPEALPVLGERGGASVHPLVAHLSALADLHGRGALTDDEFARAKARLLADPEGSPA